MSPRGLSIVIFTESLVFDIFAFFASHKILIFPASEFFAFSRAKSISSPPILYVICSGFLRVFPLSEKMYSKAYDFGGSPAKRFSTALTGLSAATYAVESTVVFPPLYALETSDVAPNMSRCCDHFSGAAFSLPSKSTLSTK